MNCLEPPVCAACDKALNTSCCPVAGTVGLVGPLAFLQLSAKCWGAKKPLWKDCFSFLEDVILWRASRRTYFVVIHIHLLLSFSN